MQARRPITVITLLLGVLLLVGLASAPAGAQTGPYVDDAGESRGPSADGAVDAEVLGARVSRDSATLPLTGGEIAVLALAGGAAIVVGAGAVTAGRRRRVSV